MNTKHDNKQCSKQKPYIQLNAPVKVNPDLPHPKIYSVPVNTCVHSNVPKCTQKSLRNYCRHLGLESPTNAPHSSGQKRQNARIPHILGTQRAATKAPHIPGWGGRVGVYSDWCITLHYLHVCILLSQF